MNEVKKFYSDFTKLKLNAENKGMIDFWNKIMIALEAEKYAALKIGMGFRESVKGVFHNLKYINTINLDSSWTEENGVFSFKGDEDFAYFVHEASHFLHLCVDEGKYICPLFESEDVDESKFSDKELYKTRKNEYEAGWRSVLYDLYYDIFKNKRIILDVNLRNLINYDIKLSNHESKETLVKRLKEASKEEFKDITNEVINRVDKISKWFDPSHEFLV